MEEIINKIPTMHPAVQIVAAICTTVIICVGIVSFVRMFKD